MENTGAEFDLAVIGGGPAGTACAIEARRRGLRVALWERDRFPRDKVCGEFLSPESLPWLKEIVPETLGLGARIVRSEVISKSGQKHTFVLPRPGMGLSRCMLDHALWRAALAAGARVWEGAGVSGLRRLAGNGNGGSQPAVWEVELAEGECQRARAVVIACGRWWSLRNFPSPAHDTRERTGPWVGVKARFRGVEPNDAVEMYFFPGGYCGLAPVEQGMYNACCMILRGRLNGASPADFAAWLNCVARHPVLDERLRGAVQVSKTVTTAPVRLARRAACEQGALKIGDAAGFLDPFTGDGISMALAGGRLAADELARGWEEGKDAQSAAPNFQRRLGRAVRGSYWLAGALRVLVGAPAGVQDLVAGTLPWLGRILAEGTRWRDRSNLPS